MFPAPPVEIAPLTCPACGATLGPYGLDPAQEAFCPGCRAALRGQVFPAWWTPTTVAPVLQRAMDGEAVCFFHPANRAVLPCDACGRFVCTICDLHVGSRHLCPVCLSKGLSNEKLEEIVPRRFIWSRTAFWLGLLPLLFSIALWPIIFATGGTAVIIALIGWKRPGSLVRGRQRWAAILGILLGLLQVGVWCGFIFLIAFASRMPR
jgi:hypothetical protein